MRIQSIIIFFIFILSGCILPEKFTGSAHAGEPVIYPATHYKGFIKIERGKAVELGTTFKVVSVAIGIKEIADVIPVSPQRIRILGLQKGTTNLIIGYKDHPDAEYEILVNDGFKVEVIGGIVTIPDASLMGW